MNARHNVRLSSLRTIGAHPFLVAVTAFVAVFALHLPLRLPLYTRPGVLLGWNSDSAIYGLMAQSMSRNRELILFFWGADYLGTLTSLWTLLASTLVGGVTPLALRVGATLQVAAALTFCWFAFRSIWGRAAATIATVWLTAGPRYFFELSYAPLSAEQMLFIGAIVLWYVTRTPLVHPTQWWFLGALAGAGWWAHRGVLFAVLPALAASAYFERERLRGRVLVSTVSFVSGVAVGVIPWVIGRTRIDQSLYEPVTAGISFSRLSIRLSETLLADVWRFMGADAGMGVASGVILLASFVIGLRESRWRRQDVAAVGTIVVSFAFWVLSPQAYSGATRYLSLALPVFFAVCAHGMVTLWRSGRLPLRVVAVVGAAAVATNLYHDRAADVAAILAASREQHEHWPGNFDPRPTMARIEAAEYGVCYADFWIAYKLEWLTRSGVEFIPYRSVNRTRARSLRLLSEQGPKCFVATDGTVHALSNAEEARFASEAIAAIRRSERKPRPTG